MLETFRYRSSLGLTKRYLETQNCNILPSPLSLGLSGRYGAVGQYYLLLISNMRLNVPDLVWLSKGDGRARVTGRTIPNDIPRTSSLVKVVA